VDRLESRRINQGGATLDEAIQPFPLVRRQVVMIDRRRKPGRLGTVHPPNNLLPVFKATGDPLRILFCPSRFSRGFAHRRPYSSKKTLRNKRPRASARHEQPSVRGRVSENPAGPWIVGVIFPGPVGTRLVWRPDQSRRRNINMANGGQVGKTKTAEIPATKRFPLPNRPIPAASTTPSRM